MSSTAAPLDLFIHDHSPSKDDGVFLQKNDLQNSDITPITDSASSSTTIEGANYGWLGGIGNDFRCIASTIKSTVPQAFGDFADFCHQSAIKVATEIAELERENDSSEERWGPEVSPDSTMSQDLEGGPLSFPWEVTRHTDDEDHDTVYMTDQNLMDLILDVSLQERNFLQPYSSSSSSGSNNNSADGKDDLPDLFPLDEPRVQLISRLLDIDDKLATMQARLSGRNDVNEIQFWNNYFFHCENVRNEYFDNKHHPTTLDMAEQHGEFLPAKQGEDAAMQIDDSFLKDISFKQDRSFDESSIQDDDGSLVPASLPDDSSYVIPSAPPSTVSIDDLVVVGQQQYDENN